MLVGIAINCNNGQDRVQSSRYYTFLLNIMKSPCYCASKSVFLLTHINACQSGARCPHLHQEVTSSMFIGSNSIFVICKLTKDAKQTTQKLRAMS